MQPQINTAAYSNHTAAGAYETQSDEALLRLIQEQNAAAYEVLYDRHAQTVYSVLMRIVREQRAAEDLLQEVFWQVWRKSAQYQGSGSVAAWIYRIARNRGLDHLRRLKARPQHSASISVDEIILLPSVLHESSAESMAERKLTQGAVHEALRDIPHEQRICLELSYFEGMSQQEIADATDTSLGTIKSRVRLGMEKLKRSLHSRGYP